MYCQYCGKPISDDAKFCGICGKEQIKKQIGTCYPHPPVQENKPSITNTRAVIFTVISLITELVIIILTFTDLFTVKIGNSYMSYSYDVNVFDFFDNAHMISVFAHGNSDTEEIAGGLVGFGVILLICMGICIIYYLYNLSTYPFFNSSNNKYLTQYGGWLYSNYSLVPSSIYIFVSSFGLIVFSANLGEIGSVSPNASLIIIYILTAVQLVINKIY